MTRTRLIFALAIASALAACKAERPAVELAEIKSRHLWEQRLPSDVASVSLAGSVVMARAAGDELHYLDAQSGKVLRSGTPQDARLVGSIPVPVFAVAGVGGDLLAAHDDQGGTLWEIELGARVRGGTLDPGGNAAFILTTPAGASEPVTVHAIDLTRGQGAWSVEIPGAALDVGWLAASQMSVGAGQLWVALGGRVAALGVADGALVGAFNRSGEGRAAWLHSEGTTWLAADGQVAQLGLGEAAHNWSAQVQPGAAPETFLGTPEGALVTFRAADETTVALLDLAQGQVKWKRALEGAGRPVGTALVEGRVFLAAGGTLWGLGLADGEVAVEAALDDEALSGLFAHEGGLVLLGASSIERRNPADGAVQWRHEGFQAPSEDFREAANMAAAVMAGAAAGAAELDAYGGGSANIGTNAAKMMINGVGAAARLSDRMLGQTLGKASVEKVPFGVCRQKDGHWGDCEVTVFRFATADTTGAGGDALLKSRVAAAENTARAIAQGISRVKARRPRTHAVFLRSLTSAAWTGSVGGFSVNLVLVDLTTGAKQERGILDSTGGCYPEAVIDPGANLAVEFYIKHGAQCSDVPKLDAIKVYPEP